MTERKRKNRSERKARLEQAGFEFEQIPEGKFGAGKWVVWLPIKVDIPPRRITLQKSYKHLTTAVSAGIREIDRVKALRDAKHDIGEDWETALAKFDDDTP